MWSWQPLVQNEYVLFCFLCFVIVPRGNPHPDPKRLSVVPNTTSKQKQSNCTGFSSVPRKQSKFLKGSVKTDISKQKSLDSHNYKKDNDNLEEYSVDAASSITTSNKLKPQIAPKPVNPKIKSVGSGLTPQSSKTPILENPQQATPDDNTYINMTINDQAYVQPDPKVDPSAEYMFDGDRDDAGRYFVFSYDTKLIGSFNVMGMSLLCT